MMNGSYSVAGIDVCIGLEIFQDLFQVSTPGSSEEAGIVIRLKEIEKRKGNLWYSMNNTYIIIFIF